MQERRQTSWMPCLNSCPPQISARYIDDRFNHGLNIGIKGSDVVHEVIEVAWNQGELEILSLTEQVRCSRD